MNGKTAKMLREMHAMDKNSKKLWKSLNANQRSAITKKYRSDGAGKAVVELGKQLGLIK